MRQQDALSSTRTRASRGLRRTTDTAPCQVEFVGGPSDGLVLSDPHFRPRGKLQMPAMPAIAPRGHNEWWELGHWFTTYQLASRRFSLDEGHPATCLRYDFLGYEPVRTQIGRASRTRRAQPWLTGMGSWLAHIRHRISKWMLEPLDYPLRVSNCIDEE